MSSPKVTFLHTVNNFAVVGLLITPMVVSYWRGTWGLMDRYLLPREPVYSPWVSVGIGVPLLLMLNLLQSPLRRLAGRTDSCVVQHVCHVLYVYVHGFANVNHWRGVWKLLDVYTGINATSVVVCAVLAVVVKAVMRTLYNTLAPPILVATDFSSDPFTITTRFRTDSSSCSLRFALDALFTVGFMGSAVVLFWRGTWEMFDLFLFPGNAQLTALSCLAIGFLLYLVQTVLQFPVMRLSRRLEKYLLLQVVLEDIFNLVSAVCAVSYWRGVWLTCDLLLLPDAPTLSLLVSHAVGTGVLYLACAGRSVIVTGCVIDGEAGDGAGVRLGHYLRMDDLLSQYQPQSPEDGEGPQVNQVQMDKVPGKTANAAVADDMIQQSRL
ncbi:Hypp2330 [Branchiostoma lanceolatum]|uniref:Hypp2330 protein n=1 Tax=Branchiostoma lanceolatum TaxID=7740 RepID=A0A8J9ZSH4_BRALA|nr:Hypp2330 [Branchiostoma lanceolatum]